MRAVRAVRALWGWLARRRVDDVGVAQLTSRHRNMGKRQYTYLNGSAGNM